MTNDTDGIAITGIAAVAAEAFLEALLIEQPSRTGNRGASRADTIREACEASAYWPEFREAVARGDVQASDIADNPALAQCVLGWATA